MFRKRILTIVFVLLWHIKSFAGGYPPTDIELKAAYCVDLVTEMAKAFDVPIADSDSRLNSESLNFLRIEREKALANLNRVRSYLLPKSKYLDADALILAINRSKSDRTLLDQCMDKKSCSANITNIEKTVKCYEECNKETGGTRDRLKMCSDLSWLPF